MTSSYRDKVSADLEWSAYRSWAGLPKLERERYIKVFSIRSGIAKSWAWQLEKDTSDALLAVRSGKALREVYRLLKPIPVDLREVVLAKMPLLVAQEVRTMIARDATLKARAGIRLSKVKAAFKRKPTLVSRPFGEFEDWDECVEKMIGKGKDQRTAEKICGRLKADLEGKSKHGSEELPRPEGELSADGRFIRPTPSDEPNSISMLQGLAVALLMRLADPMMPDKLAPQMLSALGKAMYDASLSLSDQPAKTADVRMALDQAAVQLDDQTAENFERGTLNRIIEGIGDHYAALVGEDGVVTKARRYIPESVGPNWQRLRKLAGKVPQVQRTAILVSDLEPAPNPRGLSVREAVANTLGKPRYPTAPIIRRGIEWNPILPVAQNQIYKEQTSDGRTIYKVRGAPNMEFSSIAGAEGFLISSNSWPLLRPAQIP